MPIQMSKPTPQNNFELIDIEKMCEGGLFREKDFRERVNQTNWDQYANKEVLVKGCGSIPIPTWAYMLVATQASKKAKKVLYGEASRPILVFPEND